MQRQKTSYRRDLGIASGRQSIAQTRFLYALIAALNSLTQPLRRLVRAYPGSVLFICALALRSVAVLRSPINNYDHFLTGKCEFLPYPLFYPIANFAWWIAGANILNYKIVSTVVQSTMVIALYQAALKLELSKRSAFEAAALLAVHPYIVGASVRQPQVAYVVCLGVCLLWAWAHARSRSWDLASSSVFVLAGIAAVMIRPTFALFAAGLVVAEGMRVWRRRLGAVAALCCALGALQAAQIPQSALDPAGVNRNHMYYGPFVPFIPLFNYNLYIGNGPETIGYVLQHEIGSMEGYVLDRRPIPPGVDMFSDTLKEQTFAWLDAHPVEGALGFLAKALKYVEPVLPDAGARSLATNVSYTLPYLAYGLLAVSSLFLVRTQITLALWLGWLIHFAPHVLLFGVARMRMNVEFIWLLLAVMAWEAMRIRERAEAESRVSVGEADALR